MRTTIILILTILASLGMSHAAMIVEQVDADTIVRGGNYANKNYGSNDLLRVKSQGGQHFHRRTLLRFDLSDIATPIENAVFRITQMSANAQQVRVFGLADGLDDWDEETLTYNSASAMGLLNDLSATDLGTIDFQSNNSGETLSLSSLGLTTFLQNGLGADGLITFMITSTQTSNWNEAQFASRESSFGGPSLSFDTAEPVPLPAAALLFAPAALVVAYRRRTPST